jgi:hypothetical protein
MHVYHSRRYDAPINRAIREFGLAAFDVRTLASNIRSRHELNELERKFIAAFAATDPAKGFNLCKGGPGRPMPPTDETKEKMSLANSGANCPGNRRKQMSRSARKRADTKTGKKQMQLITDLAARANRKPKSEAHRKAIGEGVRKAKQRRQA